MEMKKKLIRKQLRINLIDYQSQIGSGVEANGEHKWF